MLELEPFVPFRAEAADLPPGGPVMSGVRYPVDGRGSAAENGHSKAHPSPHPGLAHEPPAATGGFYCPRISRAICGASLPVEALSTPPHGLLPARGDTRRGNGELGINSGLASSRTPTCGEVLLTYLLLSRARAWERAHGCGVTVVRRPVPTPPRAMAMMGLIRTVKGSPAAWHSWRSAAAAVAGRERAMGWWVSSRLRPNHAPPSPRQLGRVT